MRSYVQLVALSAVAAALATPLCPAGAQGLMKRLEKQARDRAAQKANEAVNRSVDKGVDATVDAAGTFVRCVVSDTACAERARSEGKAVRIVDADGRTVREEAAPAAASSGSAAAAAAPAAAPSASDAFLNFDFKPGTTPLYVDDFMGDAIGDFPRRLEFVEGNMEVAELAGVRYLRASSSSEFRIVLPETLPEKFTLEFEFTGAGGWYQSIYFVGEDDRYESSYVYFRPTDGGLMNPDSRSDVRGDVGARIIPVRIMADGKYVKVYMDGTRVANVPNSKLGRTTAITFTPRASADAPALFGNFRLMAGGRDLYEAIAETGRVATQGIFFDTGADRVKPESAPTLTEIARMLAQHPELTLTIEGHTDDAGDDAANMSLSERRAAAVKAALVTQHGVAAERLTTKGLGEQKPAAPNTTAEGRATNRRVELVRGS